MPVLKAEKERVGRRLEMPKVNTQNAPTRGRRRRIVAEEEMVRRASALQQSVEAICGGAAGGYVYFCWASSLSLFGIRYLML